MVDRIHPLRNTKHILPIRCKKRRDILPKFNSKLVVDDATATYLIFQDDCCFLMELAYTSGKPKQSLNISEELNENDYFNVVRLDVYEGKTLAVLEYDDWSVVCAFVNKKVV